MGTLRINTYPASVLFDSGASHSFISISFAHDHQIPFAMMDPPLVVKTPGSSWRTNWISPDVQISVGSVPFPFSLIALRSEGIDVILGMDWLVKYQANLDCAAKTVTVFHPRYGECVMGPQHLQILLRLLLSRRRSVFISWKESPRLICLKSQWCVISPMSFRRNCPACHLIAASSL